MKNVFGMSWERLAQQLGVDHLEFGSARYKVREEDLSLFSVERYGSYRHLVRGFARDEPQWGGAVGDFFSSFDYVIGPDGEVMSCGLPVWMAPEAFENNAIVLLADMDNGFPRWREHLRPGVLSLPWQLDGFLSVCYPGVLTTLHDATNADFFQQHTVAFRVSGGGEFEPPKLEYLAAVDRYTLQERLDDFTTRRLCKAFGVESLEV